MAKKTTRRRIARAVKKYSLRNAPLFALTAIVSLCVEVFTMGGIQAANTASVTLFSIVVPLALPEMAMSISMTLIALVLASAAAAQHADPRPEQRRRAGWTQALAVLVLAAPVFYAGSCVAITAEKAERAAYVGSEQYRADLEAANDPTLDSLAQRSAADALGRANPVTHADAAHLIPGMAWIALLLGCNMAAVRFGWRALPETEAQRRRRMAKRPKDIRGELKVAV